MATPTYDELAELVSVLRAEIVGLNQRLAVLEEENRTLKSRIVELETQLRTNSRNSSKPPSSDGLAKPAPKSLRRPTGRRPGGQTGHQGTTLTQVKDPAQTIRHEPDLCSGCGSDLTGTPQVGVNRTQVFDIPPTNIEVVEHQMIHRRCACGVVTAGTAPAGASAPVQYGPRAQAIMVYLFHGQFLSKQRTAHALSELFGTPVSTATITTAVERAAHGLTGFLTGVRDRLKASPVVHFDETGLRCEGRLAWLHSASNSLYTLIHADRRRGHTAMDTMGVLPGFTGVAVHDAFAPYDSYTTATHALCNAHLQRELAAVTEHQQATGKGPGPDGWCWATQTANALLAIKQTIEATSHTGRSQTDTQRIAYQTQLITSAAAIAIDDMHNPANKTEEKHRALAKRIHKRLDDYLRFTTNPAIPFSNNPAEQEIRMVKLRQKISGCMRTLLGAQHFAAIRSYTATTTKHGLTTLNALTRLTTGNPWQPATTT